MLLKPEYGKKHLEYHPENWLMRLPSEPCMQKSVDDLIEGIGAKSITASFARLRSQVRIPRISGTQSTGFRAPGQLHFRHRRSEATQDVALLVVWPNPPRKIAGTIGTARSTALDYLKRADPPGLAWPLAAQTDDAARARPLFMPLTVRIVGNVTEFRLRISVLLTVLEKIRLENPL